MNGTAKRNSSSNIITVVVGALLMGFLWSVRGAYGWGSAWGLLNTGFIYTSFIVTVLGGRSKLGLGWFSITSIIFMLTTPAWGTLLYQICGYIKDYNAEGQEVIAAEVSAPSAIFLMLCVGFGMAVLYGLLLGRAYSDTKWELWHFAAVLLAFYGVDLVSRAFFGHWILEIVQPQAKEVFAEGLRTAGVKGGVWENYMKHLLDEAWAKKIAGGRNYFTSVKAIASALRAAAAILTVRFVAEDKRSARVGFAVSGAFAFAITVSDLIFFFSGGGWHNAQGFYLPASVSDWNTWEYLTGFIAGFIITAVMLKLNPKEDADDRFINDVPAIPKEIFTFLFGYVVLIGVNTVRPVMLRFDRSLFQIFGVIIASVLAVVIMIFMTLKCGVTVSKVDIKYFSSHMLLITAAHNFIVLMFVGTSEYVQYTSAGNIPNIFIIISFAAVTAWSAVKFIRIRKNEQGNT